MRDVESLRRKKVYKTSKLRIIMGDRIVIMVEVENGADGTGGIVGGIIEEVKRRVMKDDVGEVGIYVTPPRMEVELGKTLKENGLVPTGKVRG